MLNYEKVSQINLAELVKAFNKEATKEDREKLALILAAVKDENGKAIGYRKRQAMIAQAFPQLVKAKKPLTQAQKALAELKLD